MATGLTVHRVLLVEDELVVRLSTAELLREAGYEVIEAVSGDEAKRLFDDDENVDLLLTDVQMPGRMDGVQLAAYLRQKRPDISVIIVSGLAADIRAEMDRLQPVTFMTKPYEDEKIVVELNRLLFAHS